MQGLLWIVIIATGGGERKMIQVCPVRIIIELDEIKAYQTPKPWTAGYIALTVTRHNSTITPFTLAYQDFCFVCFFTYFHL